MFQSTPLREGRHVVICGKSNKNGSFNPRPCARGDRRCGLRMSALQSFQSTPLREGRPCPYDGAIKTAGFNPRPCARGDRGQGSLFQDFANVSIHAPARGATRPTPPAACRSHVSIHAPARGATIEIICMLHPLRVSIHAPARGATPRSSRCRRSGRVSIHAPARGATGVGDNIGSESASFNPRPCARGDRLRPCRHRL